MTMMVGFSRPLLPLFLITSLIALPSCGDDAKGDAEQKGEDADAEVKADTPAPDTDEPVLEDDGEPDTNAPAAAPAKLHTGLDHYRYWASVPAFLKAPVTAGGVVGANGAIAVMSDGHVGVTRDGGANWVFSRHTLGWPIAASGFDGGLWVVAGASGYVATSPDGLEWTTLPRLTSDNLVAVIASDHGIVAAGKKGAVVRYEADGAPASKGWFPDKFKAGELTQHEDQLLAVAGKKVYGSEDGDEWERIDDPRGGANSKVALTSAGTCYLGKVTKKKKGVVCSVSGTAFGVADGVALVAGKKSSAFTNDGGETWQVSDLSGKGITTVIGSASGPYFALGKSGMVYKSGDGVDWVDQEWDESETFLAGLVDGSTVLFGATGGTIAYSKDGGNSFDYADIEFDIDIAHIAKQGGKYIATDGEWSLESADAVNWAESGTVPERPERGGDCEALPDAGGLCAFESELTTPEELGSVRSFRFDGDSGMAMGDAGLVALTRDGGRSWNAAGGLGMGKIFSFDVAGEKVLATDGRRIAYSTDGGSSFAIADIAAKKPTINYVFIASDGVAFAGGPGVMFTASSDLASWSVAATRPKDKTRYARGFDVGETLFTAGTKGELLRSSDGKVWEQVSPGFKKPIQGMAGEGDLMFAITLDDRYSYRSTPKNELLRSDDAGVNWRVVNIPPRAGRVSQFEWKDGKLWRDGEYTEDDGNTWRSNPDMRWGEELPDLDGKKIRLRRGGSVTIVGTEKEDALRMENIYTGERLECDESSDCWMLAGGTLYRPH